MEVFEEARLHDLEMEETESKESKISNGDLVLAAVGMAVAVMSVTWITLIHKM